LGILRVAAVVEAAGYPVDVLDLSGIQNYADVVRTYLSNHDTMTFCLTATTPQMPAVGNIVGVLRQEREAARIVLGGPHVTLVNAAYRLEAKKDKVYRAHHAFEKLMEMFDSLVAGDGEDAVFEALGPQAPRLIDADQPKSHLFLKIGRASC